MKLGETEPSMVVLAEDYKTLLTMTDAVMVNNKESNAEYIIAKVLSERIEDAILNEEPHIQFTENEVSCMSSLV